PTWATGFGQRAVSCDADPHAPLPLRGKGEAGLDVLLRQVREVIEDFGDGHSRREVGEDIVHGNAHATDARPAAPLAWLDGDPRSPLLIHQVPPLAQWTPARVRSDARNMN